MNRLCERSQAVEPPASSTELVAQVSVWPNASGPMTAPVTCIGASCPVVPLTVTVVLTGVPASLASLALSSAETPASSL